MSSSNVESTAAGEVQSLLVAHCGEIGPWATDEVGEIRENDPIPGAILAEWVVVMSWVDPADGRHYTTRLTSPGLPAHHETGLLHEALDM